MSRREEGGEVAEVAKVATVILTIHKPVVGKCSMPGESITIC